MQRLSEELTRFDQTTLQAIRTAAAEHETRRAGILNELQALAASIGTFRSAREPVQPVTQSPAKPMLSYHDELEANLCALLNKGSPN